MRVGINTWDGCENAFQFATLHHFRANPLVHAGGPLGVETVLGILLVFYLLGVGTQRVEQSIVGDVGGAASRGGDLHGTVVGTVTPVALVGTSGVVDAEASRTSTIAVQCPVLCVVRLRRGTDSVDHGDGVERVQPTAQELARCRTPSHFNDLHTSVVVGVCVPQSASPPGTAGVHAGTEVRVVCSAAGRLFQSTLLERQPARHAEVGHEGSSTIKRTNEHFLDMRNRIL